MSTDPAANDHLNLVMPGIYRLSFPMPIGLVGNAYLIYGQSGWGIIDTSLGTPENREVWLQAFRQLGIKPEDITHIALTHHHVDHMGCAGWLQGVCNASVFISEAELESAAYIARYAESGSVNLLQALSDPVAGLAEFHRQSYRLTAPYPQFQTIAHGDSIKLGDLTLEAVFTPGHSNGHICFFEPSQGILFSGDHVLPTISPIVGKYPYSIENPLQSFLASLSTVGKLDVKTVLPGHGLPFDNLHERIDEIILHHLTRLELVWGTLDEERHAADSARMVFGPLNPFDRILAFFETLAHLEFLFPLRGNKKGQRLGLFPQPRI